MKILAPSIFLGFIVLLTVSGCSSSRGLNRQALQQSFHEHPDVVTDQDIAKTLALQGHLPAPYRLAIFYKHKDFPGSPTLRKVDWVSADAERLQRALEPVKEEGILQQSFLLANSTRAGHNLSRHSSGRSQIQCRCDPRDRRRGRGGSIQQRSCLVVCDRPRRLPCTWYRKPRAVHDGRHLVGCAVRLSVRDANRRGRDNPHRPGDVTEDKAAIAEAKDVAMERFGKELADMLRVLREKQRGSNVSGGAGPQNALWQGRSE